MEELIDKMLLIEQILLKANPNFNELSNKEELHYKINFFKEDKNREIFDEMVIKDYLDLPYDKKIIHEEEIVPSNDLLENIFYVNNLLMKHPEKLEEYNFLLNLLSGYGDDYITINDFISSDYSILDLKNVSNLNRFHFIDQNILAKEEILKVDELSEYDVNKIKNKIYDFKMPLFWIRTINDNALCYISLSSVYDYISEILLSYLYEIPDERKDINGSCYDILTTIQNDMFIYLNDLDLKGVVEVKHEFDDENELFYVVLNDDTAQKISFESFRCDINNNLVDEAILDDIIDKYKNLLRFEILDFIK